MVNIKNMSLALGDAGLKNINLETEENEMITLIGKSGSGKTVLLKTILGIIKPDSGDVKIFETNMHKSSYKEIDKVWKRMGVLFQNNALFDSMNVYGNVAMALSSGYRNRDYHNEVNEILETIHLPDIGDKQVHELSGGMMKRVAIARAMVNNPDIIFYDEPISGLDPLTSETIIDLIRELFLKKRRTTIVITHDMRGFIDFTDRILLIDEGSVRFIGTREEFLASEDEIIKKYSKAAGIYE